MIKKDNLFQQQHKSLLYTYDMGASCKSVQFLNACIYPCNGRTRLSKVPLETYRSHEEFDVFHV